MQNIMLLILLVGVVVVIRFTVMRRNSIIQDKRDHFIARHSEEVGYLCDGQENLGDHKIQLYGGMIGKSVKPGDQLVAFNGKQYAVDEVYADKKTPNKPSVEMPQGDFSCALVITAPDWNSKDIDKRLTRDGVMLFKIV
jgi:hypothetical protein